MKPNVEAVEIEGDVYLRRCDNGAYARRQERHWRFEWTATRPRASKWANADDAIREAVQRGHDTTYNPTIQYGSATPL